MQKIRKAVFPVAGLGTRFLPATKTMPKEMLPVVDKPLIHYAVEEAKAAGIEEFIFITGKGKTAIEDYFDSHHELERVLAAKGKEDLLNEFMADMPSPEQFTYVRQHNPMGLGHAIWCAKRFVADEPFAILLADDLVLGQRHCLVQMVEQYERQGDNVIGVMEVPPEHTNRYGIIDVAEESGALVTARGVIEKPEPKDAPSQLAFIGRYILQPQVFDHLDKMQKGAGGEIQLTDAINAMIGEVPVHGFRFEGKRYDCGSKIGFLEANLAYALSRDDMREDVMEILASQSAKHLKAA